NRPATTFLGQKPYLPETLLISPAYETRVVNLEKDGASWEMAVSSTSFLSQGKERLLISLKNIHSVLEQNETEAWQKLIRVLTHEIMNSITPVISRSETLSERKIRLEKAMERMSIMHRSKHFPRQLSGGQQQRVAIARAVVAGPKLILADEPTGNLDSKNGKEVMGLLSELNKEGTTIIMVTHSQHDAEYAERVIHLFDGQVVAEVS
ncbi:hypothetical protein EZS27_032029, partial [termite gut metagenome]